VRPAGDSDVARLLDQRVAQGLPRHVTDRAALGAVASIVSRRESLVIGPKGRAA
jgi:hypothetical protein